MKINVLLCIKKKSNYVFLPPFFPFSLSSSFELFLQNSGGAGPRPKSTRGGGRHPHRLPPPMSTPLRGSLGRGFTNLPFINTHYHTLLTLNFYAQIFVSMSPDSGILKILKVPGSGTWTRRGEGREGPFQGFLGGNETEKKI